MPSFCGCTQWSGSDWDLRPGTENRKRETNKRDKLVPYSYKYNNINLKPDMDSDAHTENWTHCHYAHPFNLSRLFALSEPIHFPDLLPSSVRLYSVVLR